jgi:hypothetical protein
MDDHYAIKLSQGERWFLFAVPLVITAAIVAIVYWAVPQESNAPRSEATVRTIAEHQMPR